jgi:adenine-specific DNA-methyltransferase
VTERDDPYLSASLIAYLGNKRRLLPGIARAAEACAERAGPSWPAFAGRSGPRFLDPFSGSGGVARWARRRGFAVAAADAELYAALIGRCRIVLDPDRLERAFAGEGGARAAFAAVHAFAAGAGPEAAAAALAAGRARDAWEAAFAAAAAEPAYIARHYAPADTGRADWRRERLFYTAENARYLDRARSAVEARFPAPADSLVGSAAGTAGADPAGGEAADADAKAALLDALIYEAATRTNTSGVFKACHRGFGGHGGDALGRIMRPMRMEPPALVAGPPGAAARADAAAFCAGRPAELAYLDPPYNQHQYGSNYHLLTTVARWDRPPVSEERDASGALLDRSGIRRDWMDTRSDFCRRGRAGPAFRSLLAAVDAPFVVVSYSDGGLIALEELADALAAQGRLTIEAAAYTAYRGGKQSARRLESSHELLFILERSSENGAPAARARLARLRLTAEVEGRLRARHAAGAVAALNGLGLAAERRADGRLDSVDESWRDRPDAELAALAGHLASTACADAAAVFDVCFAALADGGAAAAGRRNGDRRGAFEAACAALGKLAFAKYAAAFEPRRAALAALLEAGGAAEAERWKPELAAVSARAAKRGVPAAVPVGGP